MKRHLLGFALFNLIVGTALLVAILTKSFPTPKTPYVYEVSKTSCRTNVRQNYETRKDYENNDSIKVTQAVLNEKMGKLNMSFDIQRETPSTQDITVKLTFINTKAKAEKDWNGEVKTEFIKILPSFNVNNRAVYSLPLDYGQLKDLEKKDNLYVKAEIFKGTSNGFETSGQNNSFTEFTPILVTDKR